MLVKQYSAIASAAHIVIYMSTLGFVSGMRNISVPDVKATIRNSSKDPSLLIFGYRWLFVHDLRAGNFVVNVPTNPKRADVSSSKSNEGITDISKRCLTSGVILATFRSTSAAYDDWCESLKISIDCEQDQSYQKFKKHYLNSNQSIDNVVWEPILVRVEPSVGGQQQGFKVANYQKECSINMPLKQNSNTSQRRQISRTRKVKIESPALNPMPAADSEQWLGKDPYFSSKPFSSSTILAPIASGTKPNYSILNNSITVAKPLGTITHVPDESITDSRSPNNDMARISSRSNPQFVARLGAIMHSPSASTIESGAGNEGGEIVGSGSKKRLRNFNNEIINQKAKGMKHNNSVGHAPEMPDARRDQF